MRFRAACRRHDVLVQYALVIGRPAEPVFQHVSQRLDVDGRSTLPAKCGHSSIIDSLREED